MKAVADNEDVVRILNNDWFDDGVLLHVAFQLRERESYISVNRLSVDSCDLDVAAFVNSHLNYVYHEKYYRRALLNVGGIRSIAVEVGDTSMSVDVEVEPRNQRAKSHAGVFTRFCNKNIKAGQLLRIGQASEEVSTDTVLLEVRMALLDLAEVSVCDRY